MKNAAGRARFREFARDTWPAFVALGVGGVAYIAGLVISDGLVIFSAAVSWFAVGYWLGFPKGAARANRWHARQMLRTMEETVLPDVREKFAVDHPTRRGVEEAAAALREEAK